MADEEKVLEEKVSSKPKLSLVAIIVLIIVGVVLAGGISFFVAAKIAADRTVTVVTKREPGVLLNIGDPKDGIIVNVGGVTGRYLKIMMTLEVEATKDNDGEISAQDEIKINDSVIQFLRSQRLDAFTPENQATLKENIKNAVNNTLGSERVFDVFITNFVIQ